MSLLVRRMVTNMWSTDPSIKFFFTPSYIVWTKVQFSYINVIFIGWWVRYIANDLVAEQIRENGVGQLHLNCFFCSQWFLQFSSVFYIAKDLVAELQLSLQLVPFCVILNPLTYLPSNFPTHSPTRYLLQRRHGSKSTSLISISGCC